MSAKLAGRTGLPASYRGALGGALCLGVVLALSLVAPRPASAYPQFQLSSGTQRCSQCHYSPAGFGLLTNWGRDESADTISMAGGDGGFLHGAWESPSWLALGGDFRGAFVYNTVGGDGSPEGNVFPMQTELYARTAFGESGLSLYVAAGARGATRADPEVPGTGHVVAFVSREHYLMWKPSATGAYVRAGRFYAPFGLRLAEHIYYVRQFTGFNLFEETYNLSGGYLAEDWEVHATAFTPPPSGFPGPFRSAGPRGSGVAVYGEKRFESMAAVGAQGRFSTGNEQSLMQGGIIGKVWLEQARLLVMAEADFHHRSITGGTSANQMVGYLGFTFIPIKGVMAALAVERYHEDLRVASLARNAFDVQINLFPWAHFELLLLGRYQLTGGGSTDGAPGTLGMLQLHYYL
jgi:hypothetical protein